MFAKEVVTMANLDKCRLCGRQDFEGSPAPSRSSRNSSALAISAWAHFIRLLNQPSASKQIRAGRKRILKVQDTKDVKKARSGEASGVSASFHDRISSRDWHSGHVTKPVASMSCYISSHGFVNHQGRTRALIRIRYQRRILVKRLSLTRLWRTISAFPHVVEHYVCLDLAMLGA
jgi:hypothetical protein